MKSTPLHLAGAKIATIIAEIRKESSAILVKFKKYQLKKDKVTLTNLHHASQGLLESINRIHSCREFEKEFAREFFNLGVNSQIESEKDSFEDYWSENYEPLKEEQTENVENEKDSSVC